MAKSKVTGMYILLLMFQQHCYYTIQIFIVTKPLNLFKQLVTAMGLFPFLLLSLSCAELEKIFFGGLLYGFL